MNKTTIVVADDHAKTRMMTAGIVSASDQFLVVGQAQNGVEACELVKRMHPDILLLDLVMPKLDGLGVLEHLKPERTGNRCPRVIVISAVSSERIIQEAFDKGVSYYFTKPFDAEMLRNRICAVMQNPGCHMRRKVAAGESGHLILQREMMQEISDIFHQLGIPAHLNGYQYLRDAILMTLKYSDGEKSLTRKLYPEIAQKYGVTIGRVERSMRHAIEIGWNRGSVDLIDKMFSYTVQCERGRPTNSEFIAMIADELRLERL